MTKERLTCVDKTGCVFQLGTCAAGDTACLLEMYEFFFPRGLSQGLPPESGEECRQWVEALLAGGENFLAWVADKVVGHAALLPDFERKDAEFLLFVQQAYRDRGVGRELTRLAVNRARELGLEVVWLTVSGPNFRALKLFRRFGFEVVGGDAWERILRLRLEA